MDAIEYLTHQHRDVSRLFQEIAEADEDEKQALFDDIADALAVHTAIEERIFYPATKDLRTEEMLLEAVEEHLGVKRILADMLDLDPTDAEFFGKCKVLAEQVEHHVKEEEEKLFPTVKQEFDAARLSDLGTQMEELADEIKLEGVPREAIPSQTEEAAPI